MGTDADDVTALEPRGRGVEGPRVVEASVPPFMVVANPTAPVTALAWLAADLTEG